MTEPPISNIAVCIGTYGNEAIWGPLAQRAINSVRRQTVRPAWCVHTHTTTLQEARNSAARPTWPSSGLPSCFREAEWLCFLDADDELDPHYIEAMAVAVDELEGDWLVQPATLGVYPDGREDPHPAVIPRKNLLDGNFMVISTLIRASQFERLGGFDDWPYCEDWDLWIRAWRDGAQFIAAPDAILRVHVNPNSRNNGDRTTQIRVYHEIRSKHLGQR